MRKLLIALLAVGAAGCATPEQRVRAALLKAGLSGPIATCMADRMTDRLSLVQLRRLQSLGSLSGTEIQTLGLDALLHRVRAMKDPEILAVVTTAGVGCTF